MKLSILPTTSGVFKYVRYSLKDSYLISNVQYFSYVNDKSTITINE